MAQNKQTQAETPESENAEATGATQNPDDSTDFTETVSPALAQTGQGEDPQAAQVKEPAATPGDVADLQPKGEKTRQSAQKTAARSDDGADKSRRRANGNGAAANGNDKGGRDDDRQIAQGRQQDDDPGQGRQVRREDDYDRPAARRDNEQRNLFGDRDDDYYDRRPRQPERGDDQDDRGRRAAQGYGHTAAHDDNERLSREYGSDYRRYSDAGYDDRNQYRSRDRAYDEGGQYRERAYQGYRPNDNGRDFERESREQPRNRWRESNVDPRYNDPYDAHRNRSWSSQGSPERQSDRNRDDQGRYGNERDRDARPRDDSRFGDRGYNSSYGRNEDRGYGNPDDRRHNEPVAGNRSNYPAPREDDRGNPGRWRDERRDNRALQADDRYGDDRPWRRR